MKEDYYHTISSQVATPVYPIRQKGRQTQNHWQITLVNLMEQYQKQKGGFQKQHHFHILTGFQSGYQNS